MTLFANDAAKSDPLKIGKSFILQFDGGSRGNPGPAGIGVTLTDEKQAPVYELAEFLGVCTNNVAEYTALLRGLTAALALGATKLAVRSDSELLVRQINGIYKVKSPDLKPLYQQALALIAKIGEVKVVHVYREGNTRADELANMAMDQRGKIEPLGPPAAK
jgi:ribonuclease HI